MKPFNWRFKPRGPKTHGRIILAHLIILIPYAGLMVWRVVIRCRTEVPKYAIIIEVDDIDYSHDATWLIHHIERE